ncbi:hypothetical protein AAKU55_001634 [Oxalobacteraceae bacterium GrIS 1.11]
MGSKPLSAVPPRLRWALATALALQLLWHFSGTAPLARARALAPAPARATLLLASLGEPLALSKAMMLYLQGEDDQAGVNLAWNTLDYPRIAAWLDAILALDPRGQYPLLAASEVYGAVNDAARVRFMLDFVAARFAQDPDRRWPWLAHAALVAKHRLHDLPLARRYAQAIRQQATGPGVPAWARELEVFILEDMNELDSAKTLIGGLISGGQISDPHELAFLSQRLEQIAARQAGGP